MPALTIVLVSIAILVVLAFGVRVWRRRRAERRAVLHHGYGPPIVVFPPPSSTHIAPAPLPRRREPRPAEPRALAREDGRAAAGPELEAALAEAEAADHPARAGTREAEPLPRDAAEDRPIRRRTRDGGRPAREVPEVHEVGAGADVDGALALAAEQDKSVRFLAPPGGTLQMLPGRLVIVEGEEAGRELRFVRLGANPQRVTLGRSPGRPYEHVQLRAQTVSRLHARLQYDEGRWHVENLSRTNPLVLNGRAVAAGAPPHPLAEGDVLELGEVVCRFHER